MNNLWYQDAITSVYSRVRALINTKLKTKYPNIVVTNSDENITNSKFPTIYIHNLQPYERGQDIEGLSINAIDLTFQVDVYCKDIVSSNDVNGVVVDAFKSMRFIATMPYFENTSDGIKRSVSRYNRILGAGDTL